MGKAEKFAIKRALSWERALQEWDLIGKVHPGSSPTIPDLALSMGQAHPELAFGVWMKGEGSKPFPRALAGVQRLGGVPWGSLGAVSLGDVMH